MDAPTDHVGSEEYVETLRERIERDRFPDPDPDLVPRLTAARHVAAAALEAGEDGFAERVLEARESVMAALHDYDTVMRVTRFVEDDRLDELDAETIRELDDLPLFDGLDVTADDPETITTEALTERELCFLDYPMPPNDLVRNAADIGLEELDRDPEAETAALEDEGLEAFVTERTEAEAVVEGAQLIAADAYESGLVEEIVAESPAASEYESADHYARVVAFNAGLAAESMLAQRGEIVTPP